MSVQALEARTTRAAWTALPTWEELRRLALDPVADHEIIRTLARVRSNPVRSLVLGLRAVAIATRNSTYAKLCAAGYAEMTDLFTEQIARNLRVRDVPEERTTFSGPWSGVHRPFNQLPCSVGTLARRTALARELCEPNARVLVLGDDDRLSIALARAGFRDLTVVDIDPGVLADVDSIAKLERLPVRTRVHDLTQPPPRDLAGEYDLVCLDPMCTIEGLRFFLGSAMKLTRRDATILCSTHLMSLLPAGQPELRALLDELGLEVSSFHPAINVYPLSEGVQRLQRRIVRVSNLLFFREPALSRPEATVRWFVSDALVLRSRRRR